MPIETDQEYKDRKLAILEAKEQEYDKKGVTKMRLVLNPRRKDDTILGFKWLEPVSYGYDKEGILKTILCKGIFSEGSIGLVAIIEPELSEDLMMNYKIEVE
jgi:hypothetical protein